MGNAWIVGPIVVSISAVVAAISIFLVLRFRAQRLANSGDPNSNFHQTAIAVPVPNQYNYPQYNPPVPM